MLGNRLSYSVSKTDSASLLNVAVERFRLDVSSLSYFIISDDFRAELKIQPFRANPKSFGLV
jgi:hypothetical protein